MKYLVAFAVIGIAAAIVITAAAIVVILFGSMIVGALSAL